MATPNADHTPEVERRTTTISIRENDTCSFFQLRDGALIAARQCRCCAHSTFPQEQDERNAKGFCWFKK